MQLRLVFLIVSSLTVGISNAGGRQCEECERVYLQDPYPVTGAWYNPEEPGTGYLLYVQNGVLLGYHFGYRMSGETDWRLFRGELEETDDPLTSWSITTHFQEFQNGQCRGCEYEAPTSFEGGEIHIDFFGSSVARVVADGVESFIGPINFGFDNFDVFGDGSVLFPDLSGPWSVTLDEAGNDRSDKSSKEGRLYWLLTFGVSQYREEIDTYHAITGIIKHPSPPDAVIVGTVECIWRPAREADCFVDFPGSLSTIRYDLDYEDISPFQIFVHDEDANEVISFRRLDAD